MRLAKADGNPLEGDNKRERPDGVGRSGGFAILGGVEVDEAGEEDEGEEVEHPVLAAALAGG
jgi:hypothetical protein